MDIVKQNHRGEYHNAIISRFAYKAIFAITGKVL